jgi:hypothetical protein
VLDVYGCGFSLSGNALQALQNLTNDFQYFVCRQTTSPVSVEVFEADPPYEEVPNRPATVYTPRNVSFTYEGITFIDYSGLALAVWDREQRSFRVHSRNPDIQYEAAYLFLLSHIGEFLDRRHLHRIHAMAVDVNGRAVLAVLPMGGGKSTLCWDLLKHPEVQFLSDDSPIVSSDGCVHAFPLRLGLLEDGAAEVPKALQRTIKRMEFGSKILIGYDYFADRISPSATPGIVFLGVRTLANDCRIEPVGSWEQFKSMFANCVVGLGLFQGLEFVLRSSPLELLAKTKVAWSRLRNARALFSKSRVYRLALGRDQKRNAETVMAFVNEQFRRR